MATVHSGRVKPYVDKNKDGEKDEDDEDGPAVTRNGKGKNLKETVLLDFALLTSISLAVLLIAAIVTVVLTNEDTTANSRAELQDQVVTQAQATVQEAGHYVVQFFNAYDESVVSLTAEVSTNTLRNDYSMSTNRMSYFDFENADLAQPLTQDSRQIKNVSMSHSSYYVTGSSAAPASEQNFSARLQNYRNRTTYLDYYWRRMYERYDDMVGVYVGFDLSPSMYRHYPGQETLTLDPTRSYDPVVRPWYTKAINNPTEVVYTAPYIDAFGKGYMITGATVVHSLDESNAIVGVVGADIVIKDVKEVLERGTDVKDDEFLPSTKLSLFMTDGIVVSDPEWSPTLEDTTGFTYQDLTNPAISDSAWNRISAVEAGSVATIETSGYSIFVYHIAEYGGQFYLCMYVKNSEIYAPVESTLDDVEESSTTIAISLCVGAVCLFLVVMFAMMLLINGILRTFSDMKSNVDTLLGNVGHTEKKLADGMVEVKSANTAELNELQSNMKALVNVLQQSRDTAETVPTVDDNPGFAQAELLKGLVKFKVIKRGSSVKRLINEYHKPNGLVSPPTGQSGDENDPATIATSGTSSSSLRQQQQQRGLEVAAIAEDGEAVGDSSKSTQSPTSASAGGAGGGGAAAAAGGGQGDNNINDNDILWQKEQKEDK